MSGDDDEVPRWVDDPDAPSVLRDAVSGLAGREVDADARARLERALGPRLGGPGSAGAAGAAGGQSLVRLAVGGVLVAAIVASVVIVAWPRDVSAPPPTVTPATPTATASADAGVSVALEQPDTAPPTEVADKAPPAPAAVDVRRTHDVRHAVEPHVAPVAAEAVTPDVERTPTEAELLLPARATVAREPREALRLVDEHARLYPRGLLAQEREVIGVEALIGLGRFDEARRRADGFLSANPRSALRQRVEALRAEAIAHAR